MKKVEIKKIIIGFVILALVAGGVYFYKSYTKSNLSSETNSVEQASSGENVLGGDIAENAIKPEIVGVDKTQFNALLSDGAKAFSEKNYTLALKLYNEALALSPIDTVYIRLFSIYNAQGDLQKAEDMLNKAIAKNSFITDYWTTKLSFLNEKMSASFANLQAVYEDGLTKVDPKTKVNLVTHFARLAENSNEKAEAIALWQKAIEINPSGRAIYQAEIDALK